MQLGMWNYSKRESESGNQKWYQFSQDGVSLPFPWDLIHCGTQPERHSHISSLKGSYAFTRHQVLRSKMPKEENVSYWGPNGHLFSQQIFIEDLNNCLYCNKCGMNERVKSVCILQSNFCPATRYAVLKPTEVTPSMAWALVMTLHLLQNKIRRSQFSETFKRFYHLPSVSAIAHAPSRAQPCLLWCSHLLLSTR